MKAASSASIALLVCVPGQLEEDRPSSAVSGLAPPRRDELYQADAPSGFGEWLGGLCPWYAFGALVTDLNTGVPRVLVDRDLEIAAVAGSGVHNGIGGQLRDQQHSFLDNWQRAENLPDELAGGGYLVRPTGKQAPARSRRWLT
jgi:hypothetical protein